MLRRRCLFLFNNKLSMFREVIGFESFLTVSFVAHHVSSWAARLRIERGLPLRSFSASIFFASSSSMTDLCSPPFFRPSFSSLLNFLFCLVGGEFSMTFPSPAPCCAATVILLATARSDFSCGRRPPRRHISSLNDRRAFSRKRCASAGGVHGSAAILLYSSISSPLCIISSKQSSKS